MSYYLWTKTGARIGANSLLLPGKVIGREAFVAAGSIVTKDVPDYKLVMGAPAKVLRDVPSKEWAENRCSAPFYTVRVCGI